ncbi:MAG: enoyl-CoA hydratase [Spirochaetes bacterium RBG_16_49_21]|nr:MAG: enoyl-CoA hydratase [Spirochaetes bacterium RBG_16_49_21]
MAIMTWTKDDAVAIITMCNGANKQNLDFSNTLNAVLDEIIADKSACAIIITSNDEKNFSQGIDVDWIAARLQNKELQPVQDFINGMNEVFKKLLLAPVPTIAAINGHAYGNGSIMSCACDFRFMRSDKGFFCFPEVNLGIPFRYGMNAFIKKAVPQYKLMEMQLTGNRYTAPELEQHHIIVKACANAEELMKEAISFAKTFQKKRGIFGEIKKRLHEEIVRIIDTADPPLTGERSSLMITD